ncbi:hypothetical protein V7S43_013067 [Phytophthora oleae]|uniref:Uncharacterized protein n=1 Tax=Phytophthora oleae TaxID=2107226 RepID=A0ABD3F4L7_9STRA
MHVQARACHDYRNKRRRTRSTSEDCSSQTSSAQFVAESDTSSNPPDAEACDEPVQVCKRREPVEVPCISKTMLSSWPECDDFVRSYAAETFQLLPVRTTKSVKDRNKTMIAHLRMHAQRETSEMEEYISPAPEPVLLLYRLSGQD